MRLLISILILLLLLPQAWARESDEDQIVFKDFILFIRDRIDIGNYRAELVDIQSVRDGLVMMHISKVRGARDEQRAILQNSANNFDGGAEGDGITITVTGILDEQSAKVRVEYKEGLGTARKRTAEGLPIPKDVPRLTVQKSFDKNQIGVGDQVKVTVTVKNTGTGQALDIKAEDMPPLPVFSYIAGYPPKIKNKLDPGESDSAVYMMTAVKEGSFRVPAVQVRYKDSKENAKSNNSEPFNILINPRNKAELVLSLTPSGPIPVDSSDEMDVSMLNAGKAPATRVEIEAAIKPSVGLEAFGLEKSFFEIPPSEVESYSAKLLGRKAGNYTITLKARFQRGDGTFIQEAKTEVVVLERVYEYVYLLLIIPAAAVIAWLYRRHREYKY